jgi:hypothetical protein
LYVGAGVVGLIKTIPDRIDVAAIEAGARPTVYITGRRAAFQPNPCLLTGRLGSAKTFSVAWATVQFRCAPVVSEGAQPGSAPSVYAVGSEDDLDGALSSSGLVGRLSIAGDGSDQFAAGAFTQVSRSRCSASRAASSPPAARVEPRSRRRRCPLLETDHRGSG